MQAEDAPLEVVLEGGESDGTVWSVLVRPDLSVEDGLYTFVERVRPGGRKARSGMGGPKLYGDSVVNIWVGRSDGTPPFILLRGLPSIEEATIITKGGAALPVVLSPVIEAYGLRFGATALPEDDDPETLNVRLAGGRVVIETIAWPRRAADPLTPRPYRRPRSGVRRDQ